MKKFISLVLSVLFCTVAFGAEIKVGSKAFTEGYLLGELAAKQLESVPDLKVSRKFGLGSTGIVVQALMTGEIDVYPEYTGTIAEAILRDLSIRDTADLQAALLKQGLVMSEELGFENTYGLAVSRQFAQTHSLTKISDLKGLETKTRAAFSPEFMSRDDGLKSLERVYDLNFGKNLQAIAHMLSYETIADDKADLIAVYSTDFKIAALDLVLLEDDKKIFPPYKAVFLAKKSFVDKYPQAWAALNSLQGTVDEKTMQRLNGEVGELQKSPTEVIAAYLGHTIKPTRTSAVQTEITRRTVEHLFLVGVAVFISVVVGIPLGILSFRYRHLGQGILVASSVIQTIPSLALLSLLIPLLGIGRVPALVALCLYSLLPVVQNTLIGFQSITPQLRETAKAIGLNKSSILLKIELPLARRNILGGVRTATIIGIGTATLAALIGAGGYGAPIISGLATNNTSLILTGAIPCALMSLIAVAIFELLDR